MKRGRPYGTFNIPVEKIKKMLELKEKGYSYGEISKELGCPKSSVEVMCKRFE